MITDAAFGMAMDRQAKWQQEVADTYVYIQGYRSPNATSLYEEWMGAPHNCEVPYVWGYPRLLHNPAVREDSEIVWDIIGWIDPVDVDFTNYFQTMWSNFARFGDPTPEPVEAPEGNDPTTWLKFSEGEYNYLETDWDIELKQDYRQRDYVFWEQYLSYIVDKPIRFSEGIQADTMPIRKSSYLEKKTEAMVWEALKKTLPGHLIEELLALKS
ncbi:hypothetical protein CAPTEDRAFT_226317 [Capitella teleta]|uniref:Carboxylesterase type B domain-containing protein n=1 Tax=Capitella teleta TaxID=283909 RepID=R7UW38_CAPTE|nr:hypothetical protein CAPTEDRAFT_226317 [Capitella teleta]|eukprot:ELU08147.1 hypothetical protein CAPTEDRAFT_226317 [Capitella teleta]